MADNLLKIKITLDDKDVELGVKSLGAQVTALAIGFNQIIAAGSTLRSTLESAFNVLAKAETDMANIATLGVDNLDALNVAVQDMAQTVSKPISDLREGLYQVISAGVDTANQIDVLKASALAAKAGLTDTTSALNLGAAVIKGYGKSWSEFERIMDMSFQTVKLGQTTFGELAGSIGVVVPLAASLNIEVEELYGAMATLTGVTGDASEVATQLRAIMAGLAEPTKALTDLIQRQGYESVEAAIKAKGLGGILKILAEATGGSASKMGDLFGRIEAVNAALVLSTSQYDTFITKTEAMRQSTGAMTEAAGQFNGTLNEQIALLENRWTVIVERATQLIVPLVNGMLDLAIKVTDTRNRLSQMSGTLEDIQRRFRATEDVSNLIERYETLQRQTVKTKDEQDELRKITEQLAKLFPHAVTAVNEYGQAMAVNTGYIRMMEEQERQLLQIKEREIFREAEKSLKRYVDTIAKANVEIPRLQKNIEAAMNKPVKYYGTMAGFAEVDPLKVAKAQYEDFNKELQKAREQLPQLIGLLANFIDIQNPAAVQAFAERIGLEASQIEVLNHQIRGYLQQFEVVQAKAETQPLLAVPDNQSKLELSAEKELKITENLFKAKLITAEAYYQRRYQLAEMAYKEELKKGEDERLAYSNLMATKAEIDKAYQEYRRSLITPTTADIEREIIENLWRAGELSAEAYYQNRMRMADKAYQHALLLGTNENLAYSRWMAERAEIDKAYQEYRRSLITPITTSNLLGEVGDLQATADIEREIIENLWHAGELSAEAYYQNRMRMADEAYQHALLLGTDENLAYSRWMAERAEIDRQYAASKQQIEWQSMEQGLAGLFELFGMHKEAMYAQAIINTAEAITEALPNPLAATAAAIAGAAQIATIARTNIKRRATGGDVFEGEPVLVGERGPELFIPDQSGYIVPNTGGISTTIEIDYDLLAKKIGEQVGKANERLPAPMLEYHEFYERTYPAWDKRKRTVTVI